MTTLLSMLVGETALDSCSDSGIKVTETPSMTLTSWHNLLPSWHSNYASVTGAAPRKSL